MIFSLDLNKMDILSFFINSIFDRPIFYLISISLIILVQIILSLVITKIKSKFINDFIENKTIFSLITSSIVALPGSLFVSGMMCFTATNEEQSLAKIIFAIWFIVLSTSNLLLISFIQKR